MYEVISEPPLAGDVNSTVAWPFPATAVAPVGAPGGIDTFADVATLDPLAFVPVTATRIVLPASPEIGVYETPVCPMMLLHASPIAVQRRH